MFKKIMSSLFTEKYIFTDDENDKIELFMKIKKMSTVNEICELLDIDKKDFRSVQKGLNIFNFLEVEDCSCADPFIFYVNK